jgi:hypothetical protein
MQVPPSSPQRPPFPAPAGGLREGAPVGRVLSAPEAVGTPQEAADRMNKVLTAIHSFVRLRVHEETGRVIIRVVDARTGETIREIPSERLLNTLASITRTVDQLIHVRPTTRG